MKTIAIIIPHFGKFRNDFPFWLKSVEYNHTIDFFIFTDQEIIAPPQNVKVIKMELQDIEGFAKKYVWDGCILKDPYKICDYRPAFGVIFQNFIHSYDFWGHCDTDLIFGDIRKYITEDILDNHERILVCGHLTLYCNNPVTNSMYKNVKNTNYKEVFTSAKFFCFDEWAGNRGTSWYWVENYPEKTYRSTKIEDVAPFVYRFISASMYKEDKEHNRKNLIYSFNHGELLRIFEEKNLIHKEEVMYVHFQKRHLSIRTKSHDRYTIIPNKYIDYVDNVNISYLKKNIRESIFWGYYHRVVNKVLRILHLSDTSWGKKFNLVLFDYYLEL